MHFANRREPPINHWLDCTPASERLPLAEDAELKKSDLDTAETIVDSFHQDKNRNDQGIANKVYTDIYLPLLNQGYIPTRNY